MKAKMVAALMVCLQATALTGISVPAALAAEQQTESETVKALDVAVDSKKEKKENKVIPAKPSAEKKDKVKKAPLTIEGDELFFDDASGEVHATGNVVVTQAPDTMLTEEMRGNTKATEVWIDGVATMLQPLTRTKMTGHTVHYNYTTKLGKMEEPQGMVGSERIKGKDIEFYPAKMVSHEASMTRCPAKVPDYHISASKVEIWPGDKLIAYNAKVWIKNTVIYSIAKYQRSLRDDAKSEMPRVSYSNSDGVAIQQYLEYPLTNNWALATEQNYYTKHGYKPQYALIDRETNYTFRIDQGEFRDDDSNWVKKEPEFRFEWHAKRIGRLPWSYKFTAIYGKWTDSIKSSWHQDYILYFTRDPIQLSDTLTWNIGTGLENVRESYDGSSINTLRFNTSLYKTLSPKWNMWVGYNYTKNNNSIFAYNKVNVARELVAGVSYKIDRMNTIAFSKSYDLANERTYTDTWYWYRNLHCWDMTLSYELNRVDDTRKFRWDLAVARW